MSIARKKVIAAFGGECRYTPAAKSLDGCLRKVAELHESIPDSWAANPFSNPAYVKAHYETTGPEIWEQIEGKVDSFVAGVGSGGTPAGVGKFLKEKNPNVRVVAVEPKNVSALLGDEPELHQIQGIGDGFIPSVLDVRIINHVVEVTDEEAVNMTREVTKRCVLLVGTSAGANIYAALKEAAFLGPDTRVATVLPDRAERYFSTALL